MRKSVDGVAIGIMLLICLVWGSQQVAIKSISAQISPALQIALRSLFVSLVLGAYIVIHKTLRKQFLYFLLSGTVVGIFFALEFIFASEGLKLTTASHMSVFLYTAPAFAAIGLHLLVPAERLKFLQWAGIIMAFAGISVAFLYGGSSHSVNGKMVLGDVMGLLAGLSWGITTVLIRCSRLNQAPAILTLFYQMAVASVMLLIFSFITDNYQFRLQHESLISLGYQSVVIALISYLIWFKLLQKYLASQLGVLSFITPLFGVLAGMLFLSEPVSCSFAYGSLLIMIGIIMVSGYPIFFRYFH